MFSTAMQPLQNPLLWVSCPQAARLHSPSKLDVKCAFGPSNHIIGLNNGQETASDIQKYICQCCYKAYYSAKRIIELLWEYCHLKTKAVWSLAKEGIHYCTTGSQSHHGHECFLLNSWCTHYIMSQKEIQLRHIPPKQATRAVISDTILIYQIQRTYNQINYSKMFF